jgi:hypothetical protein
MNTNHINLICELEVIYKRYKEFYLAKSPKYNLTGRSEVNYETALNELIAGIRNKLWLDSQYKLEFRLKENFQIEKFEDNSEILIDY